MRKTLLLSVLFAAAGLSPMLRLRECRPVKTPDLEGSAFAAAGGLRSLAAEIVWLRADRLQEEGRYVELAQLASTLTFLEPHTPEVWSFAAWNLSYNISVMMPSLEDRWRWVEAALRLLRDDGLRLNPEEAELYRELAWLFQIKMGLDVDDAASIYRAKWRDIVAAAAEKGDWASLRMDRAAMDEVERATGFSDWGDPLLSAVYWAGMGLRYAGGGSTRQFLEQTMVQSIHIMQKKSRGDS